MKEKYGVELDDEKTKTASQGSTCPGCGGKLSQKNFCDKCGTEPWEKRPNQEKK